MDHRKRVYRIIKVESVDELVEALFGHKTQCLCTGYDLKGVLFLNDAYSENSAQEYAVVVPEPDDPSVGRQCESITVSWVEDRARLKYIFEQCLIFKNAPAVAPICVPVAVRVNHPEGVCQYCA